MGDAEPSTPQLWSYVQYAITGTKWNDGVLALAGDKLIVQDLNNVPVFQVSVQGLSAVKADRNGAFLTIETHDNRQQVVCFTNVKAYAVAALLPTVYADNAQRLTMYKEDIADFNGWCDYFEKRGLLKPLFNKKIVAVVMSIVVAAVLVGVFYLAKHGHKV